MHAFIKEITHFKQIPDDPYQLVGAFCCTLIPLLIGYFSGNMTSASFMSFGSLTFLYSKKQAARTLLPRTFLIGLLLLAGHAFGMLATALPWTALFVVGFFGFFSRLIFRLYKIINPGAFFVVMVTAMGTSTNEALSKQHLISCYFLLRYRYRYIAPLDSLCNPTSSDSKTVAKLPRTSIYRSWCTLKQSILW